MSTALAQVAERLSVDPAELEEIVLKTIMPGDKRPTKEQFLSFIAVANEYGLNPLTKEIYAFPSNGGIQPIVSIDGWLRIINTHPEFNGMTFVDDRDENGNLVAITCNIYRKDTEHPTQVTEYMSECQKATEPWKKWPNRMLRHKAAIQAGRYAFGLSGIIDPDEADRFQEAGVIEVEGETLKPVISEERFRENLPRYRKAIESRQKTAQELIDLLASKKSLAAEQIDEIKAIEVKEVGSENA